jgi:MFS family permease
LLYLAAGGLPSVIQKMLSQITPQEKRGSAFGLSSTFNGVGIMLATCASSATIYVMGCDGVFYVAAALFLIAMPFSLFCINKAIKD